ncbi:MAG: DegV protein [Actinomycetia bacterium]|nr:DegV protein [Actinomycetes bacterium]
MPVAIITDSAAALPPELVERHHIVVVPMWLTVGGESVKEGDVPLETLVSRYDVTTSGPTPGEFETAIKERLRDPDVDAICVCTIAATMSSTHEAAVLGARAAGGPVQVVDTTTAAGAQGLVVLAAAAAAAAGSGIDEVVAVAHATIAKVRLVAMVGNLDHLVRSGRVPNVAGWAGRRLGIAPLFEFRDGAAHPLRPARGADAALDRIVSRWRRSKVENTRLHVAALHAQAPEIADGLLARVTAEVTPATAFTASFGTVMVVHTGPGLAGLAWWWEPESSVSGD